MQEKSKYDKFMDRVKSWPARHATELGDPNEIGLYAIYGEDQNPDFGGNHHEPIIGYLRGRLDDVVHHAVNMHGFWAWGAGGRIVKINIEDITPVIQDV